MHPILKIIILLLATSHSGHCLDMTVASRPFLPFWGNNDLYNLQDRVYFFPANRETEGPTVYIPLRRWDIIFTGAPFVDDDTDLDSFRSATHSFRPV